MLSHQAFVLVLSRTIQIFDRVIVISDKVWRTSTLFASPFWFVTNIALPTTNEKTAKTCYRTKRLPAATINGHPEYDYDFGFLWISAHFSSREKRITSAKLSGFKSFRIHSPHLRFRIQNLRRQGQTFEFRPLVCKRQNQSGPKTLRIHHKSGTIYSSVNLVLMTCRKGNCVLFRRESQFV